LERALDAGVPASWGTANEPDGLGLLPLTVPRGPLPVGRAGATLVERLPGDAESIVMIELDPAALAWTDGLRWRPAAQAAMTRSR
jgi:hypothetical protein